MIEIGTCIVPHARVSWREDPPTVEGCRALTTAGAPYLRLQYNINDPAPFEMYFRPAHDAGMFITLNAVYGEWSDGRDIRIDNADPVMVEAAVGSMMRTYGGERSVIRVSPHNEPGEEPSMKREGYDISRGGDLDWIERVYFPNFIEPFFRAVRGFREHFPVAAFDSDSDAVHERCMGRAWDLGLLGKSAGFLQTGHFYGDVGGGDYATHERFRDAFKDFPEPHSCYEIDPQQLASVREWKAAHPGEPWIATDDEIRAMIAFMRNLHRDDPACKGIYFGDLHSWLFTRTQHEDLKLPSGLIIKAVNFPTFFTNAPELSEIGKEFVAAIAEVNPKPAPKIDMRNGRRRAV